ncbi:3D domain-containing protein [Desulfovibrio inopinatus]|uniref:3D domain-containing protein n=1 Tax=Desulfovibrio inopinatus TaxID=102109 RepID=UPI00042338DF|nr:3D domain-containing protein [Desulfovibrio inopinatus]
MKHVIAVTALILVGLVLPANADVNAMVVKSTAYTSHGSQTHGDPFKAAWGDRLKPGMKAIAVSSDLIPLGLKRRTKVTIDGLEGEFLVLDKMSRRWKRKIDIYFGTDLKAARKWGRRKVTIRWKK